MYVAGIQIYFSEHTKVDALNVQKIGMGNFRSFAKVFLRMVCIATKCNN